MSKKQTVPVQMLPSNPMVTDVLRVALDSEDSAPEQDAADLLMAAMIMAKMVGMTDHSFHLLIVAGEGNAKKAAKMLRRQVRTLDDPE